MVGAGGSCVSKDPSVGSASRGWGRAEGRCLFRNGDCCPAAHTGRVGQYSGTSHHCWLWPGPLSPSLSMAQDENKHRSPMRRHCWEWQDGHCPALGTRIPSSGQQASEAGPTESQHPTLAGRESPCRTAWSALEAGQVHSCVTWRSQLLWTEAAVRECFCRAPKSRCPQPPVQSSSHRLATESPWGSLQLAPPLSTCKSCLRHPLAAASHLTPGLLQLSLPPISFNIRLTGCHSHHFRT